MSEENKPKTICRFNTTLVQLKADRIDEICVALPVFQYHTGSIKSLDEEGLVCGRALFQYHTGSIKSSYISYEYAVGIEFQYHTGSIKRCASNVICPNCSIVSIPHWFN